MRGLALLLLTACAADRELGAPAEPPHWPLAEAQPAPEPPAEPTTEEPAAAPTEPTEEPAEAEAPEPPPPPLPEGSAEE